MMVVAQYLLKFWPPEFPHRTPPAMGALVRASAVAIAVALVAIDWLVSSIESSPTLDHSILCSLPGYAFTFLLPIQFALQVSTKRQQLLIASHDVAAFPSAVSGGLHSDCTRTDNSLFVLRRHYVPNVEFIVMPSNSREINLRADRGAFYSTFYCGEARNFDRASWV